MMFRHIGYFKKRNSCSIAVFLICCFFLLSAYIPEAETGTNTVLVHANIVWEMTDIVMQENSVLSWSVEKDNLWSFNPDLYPEGHTADGIPVLALINYVLIDQPIGMLIGRFGDCGRTFPMGSKGSIFALPNEEGEFLYLSMNDDIIGNYGKGFKDNIGTLKVRITQTRNN
ncbi:MAG: hypothetical protein E3K37_13990 [Candidatus Kuenenia sp.]|nr:hypothetical protein [Candidatus Kuenenia hertensis]